MKKIALYLVIGIGAAMSASMAAAALEPVTHPLFDGDVVHEIRLTFDQTDYWTQLTYNYENYDDIPYIEATFEWNGTVLADIGVRFKGNSSYWGYYGDKKSFKLDIDEFVPGQELDGLDKLSLNNCYLDPSYVREKTTYELCEALGLAVPRTNFAALYINDTYWGLYLLVEQVDQEFIESRWGASEDGNLWKCDNDANSTLEYLGSSESSYWGSYELKTNEDVNDWSTLVDFVDQLNNTSVSALPDSLHNRLDVNSALAMLAVDNYTVNLDSYVGRCANYYFYHRELDDRFVFTKWDQNEAWGIFNQYNLTTTQLQQLSPYWTNPQYGEERPLAEKLWQVPAYDEVYIGHMKRLMAGAAEPTTLVARMEELRDLIRGWVYADPNTMFSTWDFENCMTSNIFAGGGGPGGRVIPALENFVNARYTYLRSLLGSWSPPEGLVLNEVMASNGSTVADEMGDYDDWIEVHNTSGAAVDLTGLGLTDHLEGVPEFSFPAMSLGPGEYVVVWADEETAEGSLHAPFKLDGDGEDLYLTDGAVVIDEVTWPALASNVSWGRWANGTGDWQMLSVATPEAENQNPVSPETVVLYINEFVALNNTGIQDPSGSFEDWVEIYNPGPDNVEMLGLFLTDDLALTTQWAFPDTVLPAGGHLVVWCDSDESEGPLHANFKLSGSGEEIGLFGRLSAGNELIDSYVYGVQTADVSEGRNTDGASSWTNFAVPTPGSANGVTTGVPGVVAGQLRLLPNYPNPFNPVTNVRFEIPAAGRVRLEIYDVRGGLVARIKDDEMLAGTHEVTWYGKDRFGSAVSSGVYFSRLSYGEENLTGRMTLIR